MASMMRQIIELAGRAVDQTRYSHHDHGHHGCYQSPGFAPAQWPEDDHELHDYQGNSQKRGTRIQPVMKRWIISPNQRFYRIDSGNQITERKQTNAPGEFFVWVLHRWRNYDRK